MANLNLEIHKFQRRICRMSGILNIKGTILDKNQLENYMEKLASDHVLQSHSDKNTDPIPRMLQNFDFITQTYQLLNEHLKMKINIHPAGEWLLDNYYIIEETVKTIQRDLPLKKYTNFVGLATGMYKGYARIYVLAAEMAAYTENKLNSENLLFMLQAYQNKKNLTMDEIWNIGIFLQIVMIENIANVCEKIMSSQLQKYKVESIVERLIEGKSKEEQSFKDNVYHSSKLGFGEMKYPFIEYMSYRLKKSGKNSSAFWNALEEEVNKMGTNISEIIQKEHFDIALRKVSIGNSITSIKTISRTNFLAIFEKINGVEEILKKDPAEVYEKMDYKTKEYYRNQIKEISKKTKISEIYISQKLVDLAGEAKEKEEGAKSCHIGYYLLADGKQKLMRSLGVNAKVVDNATKSKCYILGILVLSILASIGLGIGIGHKTSGYWGLLFVILGFIPITEIIIQTIQYILNKLVKTKRIPKLDFSGGIPEEDATMVVIPTIVKSEQKVKELISKLEVYYLANKSDNLYFALLGDCSSGSKKKEEWDEKIVEAGKKEVERLNQKYKKEGEFPKFHFLYRKRRWNEKESSYLGWERKRGLLNQFNEYLLERKSADFIANTLEEEEKVPPIHYIITLDADTDLVLNSALELVGAIAHILNKPVLDTKKNVVIDGHALIQPKVGVDLTSSQKSMFTKIFAGAGGTDSYTNAVSDTYQDNFEEGIFTGKGIYDVAIFEKVLGKEIPENTVLSHDLLEGSYLRCGLASDILLMDGYPSKYNAFMTRLHRWTRGDWQITRWIFPTIQTLEGKKENPLNGLSKFKILDNLRRSMLEIAVFILCLFTVLLNFVYHKPIYSGIIIGVVSILSPMLIDFINRILFRKEGEEKQKAFTPIITGIKGSFYRGLLSIAFFPDKMYMCLNAIVKTIYRKNVSKRHLLEWTTAEEAEKSAKTDYFSYYKNMFFNVILGIVLVFLGTIAPSGIAKIISILVGILWLIAPGIACNISKEKKEDDKLKQLTGEEQQYLLEIGKKTWDFFKENLTEKNNYLPPDNYQEDRTQKFVNRTSSTNIGLAMLAIISSYDLGYEPIEYVMDMLDKMLLTVERLPKWNGHLYNWYQIETLEPLIPRYVSTVDSGNFVGYLYVVKQFLEEQEASSILNGVERIENLIQNTDFSVLYEEETRLFSIGFDVEENKLTESYYDLLASEARQASLVAIAKRDVSPKHWSSLSRTLTSFRRYKGLISWSGTAFEYLMPNINIRKYRGSLLDESCRFMMLSQKEYSKKLGIPWGISESAFNLKDLNSNYQYKAFGIPWLGLKRGLEDEIVVSSYSSALWLPEEPKEALENIKRLEQEGVMGKYGMYESIDYTMARVGYGRKNEVVRTFMAHHQGLILLSINNLFHHNILQERFSNNSEIKAVDILLQERIPENTVTTKEKKEKPEKVKYQDYENYTERVFTKIEDEIPRWNAIANEDYTIVMNQKGESYSKYRDIYVNRFKKTADMQQGIFCFIKNIKTKRIWTTGQMNYLAKPDKYAINYTADSIKIDRVDGNIATTMKTTIAPNEPVEIRSIELKNLGNEEETFEVTVFFEPVISGIEQDNAHMTFNNLFLRYQFLEEDKTILVERRDREEEEKAFYLGTYFYAENEEIGDLEYEIDKDKFYGRGNVGIPQMIENSKPLSRNVDFTTEPIIALKRTVRIKPNENEKLNLVIAVSNQKEKVKEYVEQYKKAENVEKTFALAKARAGEEARYLGIKGKEIELYQDIMSLLFFQNPMKSLYLGKYADTTHTQEELWKFGISGDVPILLAKIRDVNEIYVIESLLKAYEFLSIKNLQVELVILNEEKYSYEQYVGEAIENAILNRQLAYKKNIRNGIFVINNNEISKEDRNLLKFRADLIIDSHLGNIEAQLKEKEEEYRSQNQRIAKEEPSKIILEEEKIRSNDLEKKDTVERLKYYNEYGAFSNDGKEYLIKVNRENQIPTTWSHILANQKFGTLVTEGMGGYTWNQNCKLNRISAWNNNPGLDIPSEIIYMREKETGKAWPLGARPMPDANDYYITYGFGYAKYEHTAMGILQEAEVFIPQEESVKITLLRLKNTNSEKKKLKLYYYIKPVLGEDEVKSNGYIYVTKNSNIVYAKNLYTKDFAGETAYVSCSEKINSYTGDKNSFFGRSGVYSPDAIYQTNLNGASGLGKNSCMAFELEVELEAYENKEISFLLGEEKDLLEIKNTVYKYSNVGNCKQELYRVKNNWYELVQRVQVDTPMESMNLLLNGWLVYQTIASRILAKTGYYQSGGALGFRDQLQDTIGMKFVNSQLMKHQIMEHSKHQFIEGDVEHWWHKEVGKGIRTRFSDDKLWLPYLVAEYLKFTNDNSILEIQIPYVEGKVLEEGVQEQYDFHKVSEKQESIFEHCIRAIECSLEMGENGLPKIGRGDWNDGFSKVGAEGKGESVWLGFFLYDILTKWIPIIQQKGDLETSGKYEEIRDKLRKNLNKNAWDGRWFKRAFMDTGEVLGSIENEECRIDSIAQSWSVISGAGDNDKKYISMDSLENHLVDKENGIIKLLDPPFDKGKLNPGYIKGYIPGVRENGGQYTHGAIWAIIAESLLGFGEKAVEYFRMINPIEHSRTKEAVQKYKVEPYVIAADIYGVGNLAGRGGWTWYTGSSSWLYLAGIEYILGLKIEGNILKLDPCIPAEWKEYHIRYRYHNTFYHICVKNPEGRNREVKKIFIDGKEQESKEIILQDDGISKQIEVIL